MSTRGHLFVVHGKIEQLSHDAAVVPVDGVLDFNPVWRSLLGETWPSAPATWSRGWGRVANRDQWLVMVGDGDYQHVLERLYDTLRDVKNAALSPRGGRVAPLVAVPILGVGLGGHGHEPGRVIRMLVDKVSSWCSELGIDVALVTPDPSVYAAAQFARRGLPSPLHSAGELAARELGKMARRGQLALFLGAGVSIPAGLMTWAELISRLAREVPEVSAADLESLSSSATDQAELIERASPKGFQGRVAQLVRVASRPALLHALLAGLDVGQVVTTNYDQLYETAVYATGRTIQSVMPWGSALGADRWVLKLHGDVEHQDGIVLTRRHMVRYDAANRPSAALLQSLLLTRHLLVVGASFTDDNVVRLAHEVQAYREEHQKSAPHASFGTVLDASESGERARARLWERQLEWIHLRDVASTPTRGLELLLDRVGLHASSNSTWLLDERFAGLLDSDSDRELAATMRALLEKAVASRSNAWAPLITSLRNLGAHPSD